MHCGVSPRHPVPTPQNAAEAQEVQQSLAQVEEIAQQLDAREARVAGGEIMMRFVGESAPGVRAWCCAAVPPQCRAL